jgi:LytR cell envelope-related transcriptional attenuator
MESSLAPPRALVQPWRTATLVAAGVALVEFALVIALAVVLLGSDDGSAPAAAAERLHPAAHSRPTGPLSRTKTSILILNGNGQPGAAAAEAEIVKSLRYKVANIGNANRSDYGRSSVLYPPGRAREAHRLAKDLGLALVGPLDGMKRSKLHGATLALILGR